MNVVGEALPRPVETLGALVAYAAQLDTGTPAGVVGLDAVLTTWQELDRQVDQMALGLMALGVERGDRVALLHAKSTRAFVSVHAILRAGAVVVPLDPLGGKGSISQILVSTACRLVVADDGSYGRLLGGDLPSDIETIVVAGTQPPRADGVGIVSFDACINASHERGQLPLVHVDDDAYILFTSGSTGVPKGIVHTHRSGLYYAVHAADAHRLAPESRLGGTAPLHFDMSMLELYSVPLVGGTVVIIGEAEKRFPATLSSRMASRRVTHLYAVPFLLEQLVSHGVLGDRDLSALEHVAFAGEAMGSSLLASLMTRFAGATFLNAYGPAELNVVTVREFSGSAWDRTAVPIGNAWGEVVTRVVDDAGIDVMPGEPGELWVGAESCMRGYWNLPEETGRALVSDDGQNFYRTGDLVCEREDELWFLGRIDNQVKVRGVRIELEAIESALCSDPAILQSVAMVVDGPGTPHVVAVVMLAPHTQLDVVQTRRRCLATLPVPAVPSDIFVVSALPVTANGKIDRGAADKMLASQFGKDLG